VFQPFRQIAAEPEATSLTRQEVLEWLSVKASDFEAIVMAGNLIPGQDPTRRRQRTFPKEGVRLALIQCYQPGTIHQPYVGPRSPDDSTLITVQDAVVEFSTDREYLLAAMGLLNWYDCNDGVSRLSRDELTAFHRDFVQLSVAREQGITDSELRKLEKWTSGKLAVVRLEDVRRILDTRTTENPPPAGWLPTKEALALLKIKTRSSLTYHGIRRHKYKGKSYWSQEDVERVREEQEPLRRAKRRHRATKERLKLERHKEYHRLVATPRRRAKNELLTGKPTRRRKKRMKVRTGRPEFISPRYAQKIKSNQRSALRRRLVTELENV
jgi:hypothetical protein